MPSRTTTFRRLGLALLGALVFAACSSGGTDNTNPGTITLSVNPSSGSAQQGGQLITTATLTRGGGFSGTVNFSVTGAPTGVTAVVSNIVASGTITTATITVSIAATTAPGSYTVVVHGTGSGVTEATATYALTVTAAPVPAYALSLSAPALTILQGAATPTTTVNLARDNFTGNVTLTVENLPTGVTAAFVPANPISGNSSVLTLTVAAAAPAGTFANLVVRGVASGLADRTASLSLTIAAPTPSFSLSLTNAALTIPQGSSAPTTSVIIARTNFPGDVTLSVLNLPTGVTASFAPPNPQATNGSVLTLTVVPGAPTGTFTNLSVQGVGTPGTVATPLTLTISPGVPAGNFTLTTTPPTSVTVTQGANVDIVVNIVRTGGNTSSIALTTTGTLPAGLGLTLPSPTVAGTSTLSITTTGSTPVGSYPIVIHGNTAGLGEQLASLTINVVAPSGTGNVTVSFASCAVADKAVWLAFQDGTAGPWTRATPVADVYHFTINQSKGGLAYVVLGSGTSTVNVQYGTQAELTAGPLSFCAPAPTGKTLNGTAAGYPSFQVTMISFGGATAVPPPGPFQLTDVRNGPNDLVGFWLLPGGGTSHRMFLGRGLNPANGGSLGTVDFTNGAGSFAALSTVGSISGGSGGGAEHIIHTMSYYTGTGANACVAAPLYTTLIVGTSFRAFGAPAANQLATDFHNISIFGTDLATSGATTSRGLSEDFHDLAAQVATPFVLPPTLAPMTPTDLGGPYKRLQVATTFGVTGLNSSTSFLYSDTTVPGATVFLTMSFGYFGALIGTPDFSTTIGGGFQNSWAPGSGDAVSWSQNGTGVTGTSCSDGHKVLTSARGGTA